MKPKQNKIYLPNFFLQYPDYLVWSQGCVAQFALGVNYLQFSIQFNVPQAYKNTNLVYLATF